MSATLETMRHERAVLTYPYSLKPWIAYLTHLGLPESSSPATRVCVFERAVAALPSSYKLWLLYVRFVDALAIQVHPEHPAREHAVFVSLRASRALPHCPALWERAVRIAVRERLWTRVRSLIDEAVAALPVTLHARFWRTVVRAVLEDARFLELGAHVLRRAKMLRVGGDGAVELFRVLRDVGRVDEAVAVLSDALLVEDFGGDDRRELWMELVDLAVRNPTECKSIDVVLLVRSAIARAEAEVGELWAALAGLYTRLAQFTAARAVFEEALASVMAVRDFAVVFDAYAKFLETLLVASMAEGEASESEEDDEDEEEGGDDDGDEADEKIDRGARADDAPTSEGSGPVKPVADDLEPTADNATSNGAQEGELLLEPESLISGLEALTSRRPMLLSDVLLRQNPHNVHEWHKRAGLLKKAGDLGGAVETYTESVRVVDPWRASHGRPHTLWLAFARLYETASDLESARKVFDKAVGDPEKFSNMEDLAAIWCEYGEMELRQGSIVLARKVLLRATSKPQGFDSRKIRKRKHASVIAKVRPSSELSGSAIADAEFQYDISSPAWLAWKSLRVWSFLADLEESIGTSEEVFDVHNKMLTLKIATVQTVCNGSRYLESKRLFEQSFRLLDRATTAFSWDEAKVVWVVYLRKFVLRYGQSKLERTRDLFEQALKALPMKRTANNQVLPSEAARMLFFLYARMEEEHGLARRAMTIYARAAKAVLPSQQAGVYRVYIVKACELFGVTRARGIYEDAIASLNKREEIIEFSLRYAKLETRLGEIDRARGIYKHGAEVADPRAGHMSVAYWNSWNAFELEHGSEDTFRDMLRVKRTVQMKNADVHLVTSVGAGAGTVEAAAAAESDRQVARADKAAVAASSEGIPGRGVGAGGAMAALEEKVLLAQANATKSSQLATQQPTNTEEIDVDLSDDDDDSSSSSSSSSSSTHTNSGSGQKDVIDGANENAACGTALAGRTESNPRKQKSKKVDFEEKTVPAAVMKLAGVVQEQDQAANPENEKASDASNDKVLPSKRKVGEDLAAKDKPLGARERIKRKRKT